MSETKKVIHDKIDQSKPKEFWIDKLGQAWNYPQADPRTTELFERTGTHVREVLPGSVTITKIDLFNAWERVTGLIFHDHKYLDLCKVLFDE